MVRALGGFVGVWVAMVLGLGSMGLNEAQAGGIATARFGGEYGHPTADHPTAIYYNPAGLALGSGTRIFVESLFVYRTASYDRPEGAIDNVGNGTPADAVDANSGEATLGNFIVSPFLGVASDLGVENLGVGMAFFVPFGGQATWDKNPDYEGNLAHPGAEDGIARWAGIEGSLRELYISSAVSYRLPGPRLSFGLSANLIRESVDTVRGRNADGSDDLVSGTGALREGRSLVEVAGTTFSVGLGAIWEATDNLRFGVSYQSQPGFGETSQQGELTFKFGSSPPGVSKIDFLQELPDITRVGMTFKPSDKLELRLAADYTRWSVFKKQCLVDRDIPDRDCTLGEDGGAVDETKGVIVNFNRNFRDTYGVRGGASYWLNEKTELAGGLTFDTSAVPLSTMDATFIDMNKVVATLGGRFMLTNELLLNLSYTHVFYFERKVEPRQRDAAGDAMGPSAPSGTPDGAGTYNQMVGFLSAGVEYQF